MAFDAELSGHLVRFLQTLADFGVIEHVSGFHVPAAGRRASKRSARSLSSLPGAS